MILRTLPCKISSSDILANCSEPPLIKRTSKLTSDQVCIQADIRIDKCHIY